MDRAAVRSAPGVRAAALDQRADRPRPARDLRRGVGEADVGRPEPHRRGPARARQPARERQAVVSARARPRGRDAVAVRRAARRRDPPAPGRRDPLATRHQRRTAKRGQCACSMCRRTRPAPRSPSRSTGPSATRSRPGRTSGRAQPKFEDRKTGELVDVLLAYRGARIGEKYVNQVLIPLLCRKAGVPREDVRGQITGHRARATIASQLYNAKDPMSLFELQAWLGHSSPHSTQHYARITPLTLTKAYTDAGYFARNVRAIEVLLDRDAITSRRRRRRQAVRVLRPRARLLLLQLLRAMPAPDGVRPLRLLPPEAVKPRRNCSRPRTGCSGCSCRSRSPTRNAPPSRTTKAQSTGCSTG